MSLNLNDDIANISGIGAFYKSILNQNGIFTVYDLLMYLPYKYETQQNKNISELIEDETAKIRGIMQDLKSFRTKNGYQLVKGVFRDSTGKINLTWFNQPYLVTSIPQDEEIYIVGKLDPKSKRPQMVNPIWQKISKEVTGKETIQPAYSQMGLISGKWLGKKIEQVLENTNFEETIDDEVIENNYLDGLKSAFSRIHKPQNFDEISIGRNRLAFEEMMMIHLRGMKTRRDWGTKNKGHQIHTKHTEISQLKESLPFTLTSGQEESIVQILEDLATEFPMNRLLQGDVGSGKTVVAAVAAYNTWINNFSSIYLAPTQILANQHYNNLKRLLQNTEKQLNVELITGDTKNPKTVETPLFKQQSSLYIGTHAILHRLEQFENVGLIIIDEQHKFGVSQRSIIIDHYTKLANNVAPNLLTMTATPIPRSLALAFYGDLKLSVIYEVPGGRKPVITWLINESKRPSAYDWIHKEIKEKNTQVFIVCPFIEESEHEEFQNVKAAEEEYKKVSKHFSDLKVGILHGRMNNQDKEKVIGDFRNKKINILVTTTVIEVGIDIPNANIIVIENPERMGLASLHQLRGRVGRGTEQGYCILISDSAENSERLKYMETVHNGHELAEIDLRIRGPGNIYGTEQHGFMQLKVADITDIEMIKKTKSAAEEVFSELNLYPKIAEIVRKMRYIGDD